MKRNLIHRLVLAVSVSLAIAAGAWWFYHSMQQALNQPIALAAPVLYELRPGQSITKIANELNANGWLRDAIFLRLEANRLGLASRVQAGTYELTPGITPRQLLEKFVRGEVKQYQVTIVEGTTFRDFRQALMTLPGIVHTTSTLTDDELMAKIGAADQAPEGRFFPATYYYAHKTPDVDLFLRAYRQMERILATEWATRSPDLPYAEAYQALIMASIIEKEAGAAAERPLVSGVFVRRLQQHMKLQTDPTIIYGLGKAFDGNLHRTDLERDTPYNTYTRDGLPPTPIALPGAEAIRAALHPAAGDALYFVAKGNGTHEFSATLKAHQAAVARFQLGPHGAR